MNENEVLTRHECCRCGHLWSTTEQDPHACPQCGPKFRDRPSIREEQTTRTNKWGERLGANR